MPKALTFEEVIERGNAKHNNRYKYLGAFNKGRKRFLKIECPEHGVFEQSIYGHINQGYGCSKCGWGTISFEEWVDKSKSVHGGKYRYLGLIKGSHSKTFLKIECPDHSVFEQSASEHVNKKHGCPKCGDNRMAGSKIKSFEYYKSKAISVWGRSYEYLGMASRSPSKLKIKCPKHGVFEQRTNDHITYKNGCPSCAGNFSTIKPAQFYIIKVGDLYKIGVTNQGVHKRYLREGIDYKVMHSEWMSGQEALDLESMVKREYKDYRYYGDSPFKDTGVSEVYTANPFPPIEKLDFNQLSVKRIENKTGRNLISKYHYLGSQNHSSSEYFGLFFNDELIGCAAYGDFCCTNIGKDIILGTRKATLPKELRSEWRELRRFVIHPYYQVKNISSWFLSRTLKMLEDRKYVLSLSEKEFHSGSLYKACNFKQIPVTSHCSKLKFVFDL